MLYIASVRLAICKFYKKQGNIFSDCKKINSMHYSYPFSYH